MAILEPFFPLKRLDIKPGADRLESLLREPEGRLALAQQAILVVGTNGKGTMALLLEAMLLKAGLKAGTYTSPHFCDPLERIRINGNSVTPSIAQKARDSVLAWRDRHLSDASFFEITTAIALVCFLREGCDTLVVEAGLGGRLDSTNALAPLITVLTSVGLDHMERLGNSLDEIAFEKAMASRRNRTLVSGFLAPGACAGVRRAANITGTHWVSVQENKSPAAPPAAGTTLTQPPDQDPLSPRDRNARTAVVAMRTLVAALRQHGQGKALAHLENCFGATFSVAGPDQDRLLSWLRAIKMPGRCDVRELAGLTIILDNAHNPAAAKALLKELGQVEALRQDTDTSGPRKCLLVFGSLQEKNHLETFGILANQSLGGVVIAFRHESSLSLNEAHILAATAPESSPFSAIEIGELGNWLEQLRSAATPCPPILIAGSFALIGQIMEELRLDP